MAIEPLGHPVAEDVGQRVREAGATGAGGAGFPSYVKWQDVDEIDSLLINHQESEPNFYGDKHLLRTHAEEFTAFFELLLDQVLDVVMVGAKAKNRDRWMAEFESAADAAVYQPDDLPVDVDRETGVVVAYTDDRFQYGMESALLPVTAGVTIGDDLPSEFGWIVHNTETAYNVNRALRDGQPVTSKIVHVDGNLVQHRCLEVPIGTPASRLLAAAGVDAETLDDDHVLVDGGPGWGVAVDEGVGEFGVTKRTNGVLVCDRDVVDENTTGDGRVDVRSTREWAGGSHETAPATVAPDVVRLPLITNSSYDGVVRPATPVVEPGDQVARGDTVAEPHPDAISTPQHASIDGVVTAVTDRRVTIERD